MSKIIIPIKSLKVSFSLEAKDLPRRESMGQKTVAIVCQIPNTGIQLTANINAKTYRKVLKTLDEALEPVMLIIQGKITQQWQYLEEAGLIAQVRTQKVAPIQPTEASLSVKVPKEQSRVIKIVSGQPIITLKKSKLLK